MFYLILKYTFLFVLAALFGFLFGRWWAKRSFIDVTHDYAARARGGAAPWDKLCKRIDAMEASVREIRSDLPTGLEVLQGNLTEPVQQGFSSLLGALADLDDHIRSQPAQAGAVDLEPLEWRLAALEEALRKNQNSGGDVDSSELQSQISKLGAALATRDATDFTPVERRLEELGHRLESLKVPDLDRWLDVVDKALRSGGQAQAADLEPIETRLIRIEQAIANLSKPAAQTSAKTAARARKPARRTVARGQMELSGDMNDTAGLQLLESARFGPKDNLQQISGVGPKLERELNRQGVYYFWQVADWSGVEIRAMDERLEAFRGRIERDGWVPQARRLMDGSGAAARPRD